MFEIFSTIAFYVFSAICIGCFSIAVLSNNVLHSITALACAMVFLSGFYFLLGAEFIGVMQIVVYSGAVLGIFSFAMLFFDFSKEVKEKHNQKMFFIYSFLSSFVCMAMFTSLLYILSNTNQASTPIINNLNDTENLGLGIFIKYAYAFELVGLLLLIALVCAVLLTHKKLTRG